MADTTVDRIKAIAEHLKDLPDSTIEIYIEDAKSDISDYNLDDDAEERAMRYLTAHLATINRRRAQSEQIKGQLSVDYGSQGSVKDSGLDTTQYGQRYKEILRKEASGGLLFATV